MNILLVQTDGKMPNLSLMHLSTYHKNKGDKVFLNKCVYRPDKIYVSCIFSWNKPRALMMRKNLFDCEVEFGGYALNNTTLPPEIEHNMPDYNLYGVDYSMGFTSRGCIRNCPFCIVPKKEGRIKNNAPITEFLYPNHKKLILLDNNFLASEKWEENLQFVIDNKLEVNFNQGLDIRLINEKNAKILSDTKFRNWHFKGRQIHFAWDLPETEKQVERGIQILNDTGINSRSLMFYILCGFNTTFLQDMYRFKRLWEWGVCPFVMIYNNRKDISILRHFARWVNKRIYKICPNFRDYDRLSPMLRLQLEDKGTTKSLIEVLT